MGISWGRRHPLQRDVLARLVHHLQRPGQFLVCSFVMGPWAHGPMGPQPEAARKKLLYMYRQVGC